MSEHKENVPRIRFPGFTDVWEQRRFEDFITKSGEKNSIGEDYPAYSVSNKLGLVSQSEQFDGSRLDDLDKTAYKFVKPNEFAYNPARINVGSIAFNNLNRTVIVSSLYVILGMDNRLDNEYILQFIKSKTFIDEVCRNTEGSVREYLFFDNFKNIRFPYTKNLEEQRKIGTFFKQFDHLITLHQRKLNNVKNLKAGLLQKMFPKDGEDFPEVRFPGFTDAWEERRLGDISDIRTGPFGSTLHAEDYVEEGTPIITTEHFKTGGLPEQKNGIPQVSAEDLRRLQSYVLETDDIVFSRVGSVDINALVTPFQSGWLYSGRVLRVRTDNNIDSQYLHYELSTSRAKNDVIARAVGQTMPSINTEILKQTRVFISTEIKEQQEIGQFFATLDHLITLHQRKLKHLQEQKKTLLQQMFI